MKKNLFRMLAIMILASSLLAACAGGETPTEAPAPTAPPAPTAVPEPTAEPEPDFASDAALDTAYVTFLADMEAYNTIGVEAVNEMLAEEPPPFILDVRSTEEVEENGRIPTSVVIPIRDLGKPESIAQLPSFDTTIVSYCGSGWRCTIALTALEALGWEDVLCLKGGSFAGWVDAGYAIEEGVPEPVALNAAQPDAAMLATIDMTLSSIPEGYGGISAEDLNTEIVENPGLVLIDSRTAEEVESKGSLENATLISLQAFIDQKADWPADKNTPIVVYCGSGHRSTIAMTMLWSYGYTDVRSLKGGYGAWTEAGFAVVGGEAALDTAFQTFLDDMVAYNTTSLDALNEMLLEDVPPFVLDVRSYEEVETNGRIPTSVVIPLRDLAKPESIAQMPSFDTTIVSYCGSGWRCTIALTALEALGWEDVLCLKDGSFGGWLEAGYAVEEGVPEPVALDVAQPNASLLAIVDEMLSAVPDGFGGITVDDLNTAIVENPELVLIDARTAEELVEKGAIESNINIPLQSFISDKASWPSDKDAPIVIYCGSGHRSTIAMTILWTYGYTDVRSLKSGFTAWTEAGYPVVEVATP